MAVRNLIQALAFAVALLVAATPQAQAEKRVALVIGNSAYQNAARLPNPARDAAGMADLFRKAGFSVVDAKQDLDNLGLRRAVREFAAASADADIAIVFYAGHGIEVGGVNYLIPVDAKLVRDFDVEDEAIRLDRVLQSIEPARKLRFVILDACRDNPFAKQMKRTMASRAVGRGLSAVAPTTMNTLIAFAAQDGAVAADGDGQNSPYTTALMRHLAEPGLDLRIALGRVRDDVYRQTGGQQTPFQYGSLGGEEIVLVPKPVAVAAPAPANPQETMADVRRDYEFAERINTKEAWTYFLEAHPNGGFYSNLARAALGKIITTPLKPAGAPDQIANAAPSPAPKPIPLPNPPIASAAPVTPPPPPPAAPAGNTLAARAPAASPTRGPSYCRPDTLQASASASAAGGPYATIQIEPNFAATKEIRALAIAPDGATFASAGDDGVVRLWNAASPRLIASLPRAGGPIFGLAFSPDGRLIAAAGWDGKVRIWDAVSRNAVQVFSADGDRGPVKQFAVAFADQKYVVSAGADGIARVWNLERRALEKTLSSHTGAKDPTVHSLAFAPGATGEFATAGFDGSVKVFLTENKRVETIGAFAGKVLHVAYSPVGRRLAFAGRNKDRNVAIVDVGSGPLRARGLEGHIDYAVSVAWSPDGQRLVSGGGYFDPTLKLWDANSGALVRTFTGHSADVETVAFHPNGQWLMSGGEDKTLKIWDVASGRLMLTLVGFDDNQYVAYAPNGCYSGSASVARHIKFASQGVKLEITDQMRQALFVPEGETASLLGR